MKKFIFLTFIAVIFGGCMSEIAKNNIPKVELPKNNQVKNTTIYDDVLRCMDTLYRISNDNIILSVDPIRNETANKVKLPDNFKTMLLTALNKMGSHIRVLPDGEEPETDANGNSNWFVIKPAITEFDFVSSQRAGAYFGISGGKGRGETDGDSRGGYSKKIQTMAIDFNIINKTTSHPYYEPYVSTSYKMKLTSIDDSNDFGISIYGNGFGMNSSVSKEEGVHGAIRLLVEVSLSELFGELSSLPYWKCRGGTYDRQYKDRINYIYNLYKKNGMVKFGIVQPYLNKWGLLEENETDDSAINKAVIKFKKENSMYPQNSIINENMIFKILSTIPPENQKNDSDRTDLFEKYSSIKNIKLYPQALTKERSFKDDNYFEQNKKLSSIYRLFRNSKMSNPNSKLYINSFVGANEQVSKANYYANVVYRKFTSKGFKRSDIIVRSLKNSKICKVKNKIQCTFYNDYIQFDIR